jgi:hypothetical protein
MLKKLGLAAVILTVSLAAWGEAAAPELRPDHPSEYVVRKGDTLWDISGRFLAHPWRWPDLWRANPQVRNPDLIYPGDRLVLSSIAGRPVLMVQPGEVHLGGRNFKRSPVVRDEPHIEPIRALPLEVLQPFLERPQVLTAEAIESSAYVVSSQDQHLVAGPGNRIYVRDLPATARLGDRFTVVRTGVVYRSYVPDAPDAGEVLGHEALYIGDAVLTRLGDPTTLVISGALRETLVGDRVVPQEKLNYPEFIPHPPAAELEARIVGVIDAVSQVGQYQIVVLDKGTQNGLEPGNVLTVFEAGSSVRDPIASTRREGESTRIEFDHADTVPAEQVVENFVNDLKSNKEALDRALGQDRKRKDVEVLLPDEPTGTVMVFRSFEKLSYGLILDIERPVRLFDAARTPTE